MKRKAKSHKAHHSKRATAHGPRKSRPAQAQALDPRDERLSVPVEEENTAETGMLGANSELHTDEHKQTEDFEKDTNAQ